MIRSLALLSLVVFAAGNDLWKAGFSKEFGILNGFTSLPRTVAEAETAGWENVDPPTCSCGFDALTMYVNPNDTTYGVRYDENELAAGATLCLPKSNVTPYYDMNKQGYTSWNATINNATVECWSISMFFVYEDSATRIAANNASEIIRSDYVTVQGFNGTMDKIAANVTDMDSIWTKQACIDWMGQHYYYNMTTSLGCDDPFYTWFPLYDEDTQQLIAMGQMTIGTTTCNMETPTEAVVSTIVPKAPECMLELVKKYGVFTLHTYFVNHPRLITC